MNEQADVIILETEEKMNKACNVLLHEFTHVRTGRANPGLLDDITISYYGVDTPLNQIGSVSVVDGNQLYIKPYDKSLIKDIEHAINASTLGLNPINDGVGVRLILPQPTEQRRKELVREVEKFAEQAKVAIRNVRRDGNDHLKKLGLTEDDEKGYLDDVQELTNQYIAKVDQLTKEKASELLRI